MKEMLAVCRQSHFPTSSLFSTLLTKGPRSVDRTNGFPARWRASDGLSLIAAFSTSPAFKGEDRRIHNISGTHLLAPRKGGRQLWGFGYRKNWDVALRISTDNPCRLMVNESVEEWPIEEPLSVQ